VRVWLASVDSAVVDTAVCNRTERDRAAGFGSAEAGRRWLRGRATLRLVLGRAVGASPESLAFGTAPGGKPSLLDHLGVHFNFSHSGGWLAVAVADHPVGIDIEAPRRLVRPSLLADRLFADDLRGRSAWGLLPAAEQTLALLQRWTRAEALLKATGEGLGGGVGTAEARLLGRGWKVRDLDLGPSLAGAVAASASPSWEIEGPHLL